MNDADGVAQPTGRRRAITVVVLAGVLALAGVASEVFIAKPSTEAADRTSGISAAHVTSRIVSAAWYCAGPLPIGKRPQTSSIAVANVAGKAVHGEVVVTSTGGLASTQAISVAAGSEAVVGLPRTGAPAFGAATVLVDAATVGVEQIVHGPSGPISAPCVDSTEETQYVAAGSTKGANDVALALYDPGATPAVASVSVATPSSVVTPPSFQGVAVPAGGVVVLNVGRYVPETDEVSIAVTAVGGRIVAGDLQTELVSHHLVAGLIGATAVPRTSWYLPAGPVAGGAHQALVLYNPSASATARASVSFASAAGPTSLSVVVAPSAARTVTTAGGGAIAALRWASVTSTNGVPLVVGRELAIGDALVTSASPADTALPSFGPGFALTGAVAAPGRQWLIPGGESDAHIDEVVVVSNPGRQPVTIVVQSLLDAGSASASSPAAASAAQLPLTVPAGGTTVVDLGKLFGTQPVLPTLITASGPVVAGAVIYARGSSGSSVGFSAPVAIPVEG